MTPQTGHQSTSPSLVGNGWRSVLQLSQGAKTRDEAFGTVGSRMKREMIFDTPKLRRWFQAALMIQTIGRPDFENVLETRLPGAD